MKFNSPKAANLWKEAIKDLLSSSNNVSAAALKERMDKVDVIITLAPTGMNVKDLENLSKALRQEIEAALSGGKSGGSLTSIQDSLQEMEKRLLNAVLGKTASAAFRAPGDSKIVSERKKHEANEDKIFKHTENFQKQLGVKLAEVLKKLEESPNLKVLLDLKQELLTAINNGGGRPVPIPSTGPLSQINKRYSTSDAQAAARSGRAPGGFLGGRISPAEQADKRIQDDLFQRQVDALEDIAKGTAGKKTGGLLSSAFALASGLLGKGLLTRLVGMFSGKALGGILKAALPALVGLASGTALLRALTSKLGPLALAAAGGWYLGTKLYDAYSVEIQDTIESVVGFVQKTIGYVTDGFEWLGDFFKDPMSKIRALGGKIAEAWDKSVFGKTFSSAKNTVSEFTNRLISGTQRKVDRAKATIAPVVNSVSSAVSSAATAVRKDPVQAVGSAAYAGASAVGTAASDLGNNIANRMRMYNIRPGADMDGLKPAVKSNFDKMIQEYRDRGGKAPINVNSAYRSNEKQAELYRQNPSLAAPPGRSSHNFGLAIDIDRAGSNDLDKMGLLSKYGFSRPIGKEPWHLQVAGSSAALAKSGIYSADAAVDQRSALGTKPPKDTTKTVASYADTPPPPVVSTNETADTSSSRGTARRGSAGSTTRASADSIPKYSFVDSGFFMMNARALG